MAVLFTGLNIKISRLRDSFMSHMKWRRMIEPCLLVILWTTGAMVLPLFFPCTPTECSEVDGVLFCESGLIKDGSYVRDFILHSYFLSLPNPYPNLSEHVEHLLMRCL